MPEMLAHRADKALPQLFTADFVNSFVADNGEFMRSRRDEDQHGIALQGLLHAETMKSSLRGNQRVVLQLTALDKDTDLAGCFRFRVPNRFYDPIVLEFA